MAIDPETRVVCRPRRRLRPSASPPPPSPAASSHFSSADKITTAEADWANYPDGVAAELLAAGIHLVGMDALIAHTLPVGGGLSSSRRHRGRHRPGLPRALDGLNARPDCAWPCSARRPSTSTPACPAASWTSSSSPAPRPATPLLLDCRHSHHAVRAPRPGRAARRHRQHARSSTSSAAANTPTRRSSARTASPSSTRSIHRRQSLARCRRSTSSKRPQAQLRPRRPPALPPRHHRERPHHRGRQPRSRQRNYEQAGQLMCRATRRCATITRSAADELDFLVEIARGRQGRLRRPHDRRRLRRLHRRPGPAALRRPLHDAVMSRYPHTHQPDFAFFDTTPAPAASVME